MWFRINFGGNAARLARHSRMHLAGIQATNSDSHRNVYTVPNVLTLSSPAPYATIGALAKY